MLNNPFPGNAEEVIERGVNSIEGAFTDGKCEVPLGEDAMISIVFY